VGTPFLTNGTATHHAWWECDTGIAYLISGIKGDGWNAAQHVYIYDLSNPASPKFIRQWGLPGQQPLPMLRRNKAVTVLLRPLALKASPIPRVRFTSSTRGEQLKIGCTSPMGLTVTASFKSLTGRSYSLGAAPRRIRTVRQARRRRICCTRRSATSPPILTRVGIRLSQSSGSRFQNRSKTFLDGTPQKWDLLAVTSEDTTNDCFGQPWKNVWLLDITNDIAPWNIATLPVGQFPGNFCAKGSRFGTHELNREINKDFYGRLVIVAWFNAGLQIWDIRDPYSPRRVAYFIQAPNSNTQSTCGTYKGNTNYCRNATFSDLGEVDDRGYIYNLDRAGSGVTVLKLTGDALDVVKGRDHDDDDDRDHDHDH